MGQLQWIPLYIDKLLSSQRWQQMNDFQRGWYIQMLLVSARSERPGYLPLDGNLWRIAGAHSRPMWEKHGGEVMACFKSWHGDGKEWIYNERLLETLVSQNEKLNKGLRRKDDKTEVDLSLSISEVVVEVELKNKNQCIETIYKAYPRKLGKRQALVEIGRAITRLITGKEVNPDTFPTVEAASGFLLERTQKFADSPAGNAGIYTLYPERWYKRGRYLDDEAQWFKTKEQEEENGELSKAEKRRAGNERAIIDGLFSQSAAHGSGHGGEGDNGRGKPHLGRHPKRVLTGSS